MQRKTLRGLGTPRTDASQLAHMSVWGCAVCTPHPSLPAVAIRMCQVVRLPTSQVFSYASTTHHLPLLPCTRTGCCWCCCSNFLWAFRLLLCPAASMQAARSNCNSWEARVPFTYSSKHSLCHIALPTHAQFPEVWQISQRRCCFTIARFASHA